MSKLEFKNIMFAYGDHVIYDDLSLRVNDHEFLVIVGPSGAGKTTLLRILAGFEEVQGGQVLYDGRELMMDDKKNMTAMVFQNYALFKSMKVKDNIAYGLRSKKMKKSDKFELVEAVAKSLNIDSLLDRYPSELSGGEQQRVGLARAIIREPKVFLFDEPLSNLDTSLKQSMREEIKNIYGKSKGIFIYVTHDQTEASILATKLLVMSSKGVEQIGSPKEIYDNPKNIFVASFFGEPKINLLDGKIFKEGKKYFVEILGSRFELNKKVYDGTILEKYLDKEIVVGVRPEDVVLSEEGFKYELDSHEFLGKYDVLNLNVLGNRIVALKYKNSCALKRVEFRKMLLFDKRLEKNLFYK